jgi:dynein light intermediate chain 1
MDSNSNNNTNAAAQNKDAVQQIWDKILSEASQGKENRQDSKTVMIVGDPTSSSMQLFNSLKKSNYNDEDSNKLALDYSYLDVAFDDDVHYADDVMARLNVWHLENPDHKDLLSVAFNAQNIKNSLIVIALDGSEPWNLMSSIEKWMSLVKEYVQKTLDSLPKKDKEALLEHVRNIILNYVDPTVLKEKAAQLQQQNAEKGEKQVPAPSLIDDSKKLDIPKGVLTTNLGVPIIVVVCKTESFEFIEKEYRYDDVLFDFIQLRLRSFCLEYGAALTYTSVKEKKNVDLLYKYITHLLLNTDFKESAQIVEKDRVFVPIGWDLQPKINIIREQNKKVANEDEDYGSVVFVPNTIKKKERTKVLHTSAAEDDQEFLVKLQAREGNPVKQKPVTTAVPPGAVVTAEQPKRREERSNSTTETPPPVSADEITTPRDQPEPQKQSTTTPSRPHEKDRSKLRQKESSSVKLEKSATPARVDGAPSAAPAAAPGNSENVLSSFFTSLLNRQTAQPKKELRQEAANELGRLRSKSPNGEGRRNSGSASGGTGTS